MCQWALADYAMPESTHPVRIHVATFVALIVLLTITI